MSIGEATLSHQGTTEGKVRSPADKEGDRGSRAMSKLGKIEKDKPCACTGVFSEMRMER